MKAFMRTIADFMKEYGPWLTSAFSIAISMAIFIMYSSFIGDAEASGEMVLADLLHRTGGLMTSEWMYDAGAPHTLISTFLFKLGLTAFGKWMSVRIVAEFILLSVFALSCVFFISNADKGNTGSLSVFVMLLPFSACQAVFIIYGFTYIPFAILFLLALGVMFMGNNPEASAKQKRTALILSCILAVITGLCGWHTSMVLYFPLLLALFCIYIGKALFSQDGAENGIEIERLKTGVLLTVFNLAGVFVNSGIISNIYKNGRDRTVELHEFSITNMADSFMYYLSSVFGFDKAPCEDYIHRLAGINDIYGQMDVFSAVNAFSLDGIRCLSGIAMCTLMLAAFAFLMFKWKELSSNVQILMALIISSAVVNVVVCTLIGCTTPRCLMIPLLLLIPLFSILLRYLYKKGQMIFSGALMLAVVCCVLFQSWVLLIRPAVAYGNTSQHKEAAEWLAEHGYTQGFAHFWDGNIITEFSNGKVEVWCCGGNDKEIKKLNIEKRLQSRAHLDKDPQGKVFILIAGTGAKPKLFDVYNKGSHLIYRNHDLHIFAYDDVSQLRKCILSESLIDFMQLERDGDTINCENSIDIEKGDKLSGPHLILPSGNYELLIKSKGIEEPVPVKITSEGGEKLLAKSNLKRSVTKIPLELDKTERDVEILFEREISESFSIVGLNIVDKDEDKINYDTDLLGKKLNGRMLLDDRAITAICDAGQIELTKESRIFGPYLKLDKGNYVLNIDCSGIKGYVHGSICKNGRENHISKFILKNGMNKIPFKLNSSAEDLEFIINNESKADDTIVKELSVVKK